MYQVLKNLNIIFTGLLFRVLLHKALSEVQWAAIVLLTLGCATAQLTPNINGTSSISGRGIILAVLIAVLSALAGVYTEMILKQRDHRNVHVQNIFLYALGICCNSFALLYDYEVIVKNGFFHGYDALVFVMIFNHALSGIAVSLVMKYADNIVKVYSTSVSMILTATVSVFFFDFQMTIPFFLGASTISVAIYLHYHSCNLTVAT